MTQEATQKQPAPAQLMLMIFGSMPAQAISVAANLGITDLRKDSEKSVEDIG
jgi:hypothetical protein